MKHLALLLLAFIFSNQAYGDIPPPPPSKVCKDPVLLQGEVVEKLFAALNVKEQKEVLPWDQSGGYKLMKTFTSTAGGDSVRITCSVLRDKNGRVVNYNRAKPGCVVHFKDGKTAAVKGTEAEG